MSLDQRLKWLADRVSVLESEKAISAVMHQYMRLCDQLTVGFDLAPLLSLFTEDAVWEGKGEKYEKTFGRIEGRQAIEKMFVKYTRPPAHFALNIHFLSNELIKVQGVQGQGQWLLLQPSTFANHTSQLSCARIDADFVQTVHGWKISRFQTESMFNRPMNAPWNSAMSQPVPE